ncbi:hypothetical protein ADL25_24480 [Streptomyces sp. NRRL F-5122]|uniref:hypothetical protein n=1 Tax=Streptomyces sp. NRRL F-5122 TaxID=1609098 RepID=UPI0007413DF8|nr:hypothetical protein [Streptomyces sp. NRRL F-5122]KUJ38381.1 hypothetical protein ADL25_24480 [Streptomyces sp. NRRL F-5122]
MTTAASPKTRYEATTAPARLHRHGRMPWPEARALLAGTLCAWSDLDGFFVAPADELPQDVPQATHLWAWDMQRCVRVRVDGREAMVAALHPGESSDGELVTAHIRHGTPWGPDDKQAGPLPEAAHALSFELLELPGPTPATFVRATP